VYQAQPDYGVLTPIRIPDLDEDADFFGCGVATWTTATELYLAETVQVSLQTIQ